MLCLFPIQQSILDSQFLITLFFYLPVEVVNDQLSWGDGTPVAAHSNITCLPSVTYLTLGYKEVGEINAKGWISKLDPRDLVLVFATLK